MATAECDDGKCLISICSRSGQLQTVKLQGLKKLAECANQRTDNKTFKRVQAILDKDGEQSQIDVHKQCYCTYTSKHHVKRHLSKRKKNEQESQDSDEIPATRVRRSQTLEFDFKRQCLFCGNVCMPQDRKHPDRWDRVVQCERIGLKDAQPFKSAVLQYCSQRNDAWGREVAVRCHGVHDLAAAEAQYHIRCYNDFRKIPKYVDQTPLIADEAMKGLIEEMHSQRNVSMWTSIELHEKYATNGGQLTRRQLFTKLVTHFGDSVIVLSLQGCASVIGFREFLTTVVKVTKLDSEDEEEDALVRQITSEAFSTLSNTRDYDLGSFTFAQTKQQTSPTLLRLISKLVSDGEVTKTSLSLSQSVQYNITKISNQTTLGLGVKLHHKFGSKDLIQVLHEHGYTVSYDEVRRFRKSAATYVRGNAATLHQVMGLTRTVGHVFGWYDNFDLLVSTPNGRRETHAMATEFQLHPAGIVEAQSAHHGFNELTIPRIANQKTKSDGRDKVLPLLHYTGPKKILPPEIPRQATGISYAEVCARKTSLLTAQAKDAEWLNSLSQGPDAMEWNGFNNNLAKSEGILKPACTYMFGPLIDAPPSHPDTILTTLTYMQKSLVDMGMTHVHISIDMQLFIVTKQVCWFHPIQFNNVIVHPGGMHIIQSFVACIAKLMKGSALEVYVGAAYGGLTGIFNGKSWVKALRAFRGVAAALLKSFLSTGPKTFDEIDQYLNAARLHPTGRHWVDNFLVPTLLVHQFERAEREGDVSLKYLTIERMMKYFFVAGHVQYARYLTQYLIETRALCDVTMVDMVCRHHDGYWNAVSADQFGEQTAIKVGKGALKGISLSPDLVAEWIDAFPITAHLADQMDSLHSICETSQSVTHQHKEEQTQRRILDANDRDLIEAEVLRYAHPLEDSRPHLYNPVTGQIAPSDVNVADSVVMGESMEKNFIDSLPKGFYGTISSPVKTMSVLSKQMKASKKQPCIDLETIFLRLLMIGQQRQIELEPLFAYELCVVPSSLIDEHGVLRKGNKSGLVKRLGEFDTEPVAADTLIVDVSQLFYHIVWPHGGCPSDLITSIESRLQHYAEGTEKIIVFDKYQGVSAKDHERLRRSGDSVIDYDLSVTSPLPKRNAVLKSKKTKQRLANILCTFSTGEDVRMDGPKDCAYDHDEADITMISYLLEAARSGKNVIRVLSDDTDVFVLLVYWVFRAGLTMSCTVQMERWDGTVLDINATCNKLGPKCLQLLAMHALSGCDTTSYPYGKGKISALNTLLAGDFPELADVLGEVGVSQIQLLQAATPYFLCLYGQKPGTSLESARFNIFTKSKKSTKVMSLPPTRCNFLQHVLRCHLQIMLWKAADQNAPPIESTDILQFGWKITEGIPAPEISKGDPAPPELIDVISCQCRTQHKKCSSVACGCHKAHLSCTSYCYCSGAEGCCNPHTSLCQSQSSANTGLDEPVIDNETDLENEENNVESEDDENDQEEW